MSFAEVGGETRIRIGNYQSVPAIKLNFENFMLTQVSAYRWGRKLFASHRSEFKHLPDLPHASSFEQQDFFSVEI